MLYTWDIVNFKLQGDTKKLWECSYNEATDKLQLFQLGGDRAYFCKYVYHIRVMYEFH
jgi:hypothetical protein